MLGDTRDGISRELDDLEPPWTHTARVARDGGSLVGASVVEWDAETARAWVLGSWAKIGIVLDDRRHREAR